MVKEIGQFAVCYSEDLKHIIIAYTSKASSCLTTHLELCNRLKGIAKLTGDYSPLTFKNHVYLGVHLENNIPEEYLIQALSQ